MPLAPSGFKLMPCSPEASITARASTSASRPPSAVQRMQLKGLHSARPPSLTLSRPRRLTAVDAGSSPYHSGAFPGTLSQRAANSARPARAPVGSSSNGRHQPAGAFQAGATEGGCPRCTAQGENRRTCPQLRMLAPICLAGFERRSASSPPLQQSELPKPARQVLRQLWRQVIVHLIALLKVKGVVSLLIWRTEPHPSVQPAISSSAQVQPCLAGIPKILEGDFKRV